MTCTAQNTSPLGTGPYRIISFKESDEAVYERNPFYRGEPAYFDRVVITGGGDAVTAARAVLEIGEADYAWNVQVAPEMLAKMESRWTRQGSLRVRQPSRTHRGEPYQPGPGTWGESL